MASREALERLTKELITEGLLVEAGFLSLRLATLPDKVSEVQLREMRMTFFAGAQHTFASMMSILAKDAVWSEETEAQIEQIVAELKTFVTISSVTFRLQGGRNGRDHPLPSPSSARAPSCLPANAARYLPARCKRRHPPCPAAADNGDHPRCLSRPTWADDRCTPVGADGTDGT